MSDKPTPYEEIRQEIAALCTATIHVPGHGFDPAKSFEENGADSLDMLEIVMEIEEKWRGVHISDEEAEALSTVDDTAQLLASKLGVEVPA
jgi:acyl carrier protein